MTTPSDNQRLLQSLELEIDAELEEVDESEIEAEFDGASSSDWAFDPSDIVREEVGLQSLRGAVESLEGDAARVEGQ